MRRHILRTLAAGAIALAIGSTLSGCRAAPAEESSPSSAAASADPRAEDAQNVRLVGHHDLQGRESLVVTTLSDPANGSWVYVGHHESFWDGKPKMNPITGKDEWNGTSILNVDDPARPTLVWHIPNEANRNSRGVSVVYDYKFDGSGRDYLIRNSEVLTEGETGKDLKYQIFDITSRATDPSKITLVSEITGTPPGSCGAGCGGAFIMRAHKGWWSQDTGYFYAASGEPGFRNVVIQIFDLKDPRSPKFVGRAWLPSQKDGEAGYENQYAHHPVVDEQNKRLYVGYRNSGWVAEFDIADPARPKLVWSLDMNPPHRGPHTVSPIVYDTVPNFGAAALPRKVRVRGGRGGRRRRHGAVPGRRPHRLLHARYHRMGPGHSRCPCGRCRWATSVRREAVSARINRRTPSTAGSTGSRTRSRGWRISTPASGCWIFQIPIAWKRSATTSRRRTSARTRSPRSSRSRFRSTT